MKPNRSFRIAASMLASSSLISGQTTHIWNNGAATSVIHTAENWDPAETPAEGDTARWNGTVAGDLMITFSGPFGGGGGTAGVVLDVTSTQLGSLTLTGNTIRVQDITIAQGAGMVTLGPVQIGGLSTASTHLIANNSAYNVLQGTLLKGGGNLRDVTITGSGDYTINGVINPSTSDSNGFNLIKSGSGTLFITADNLNQANVWNSKLTIETGAVQISKAGALGAPGSGVTGVTTLSGGGATGRLELIGGINVAESITLNAKNAGINHLVNASGNNTLSGDLTWSTGGIAYGVKSDAGKLTFTAAVNPQGASKTLNVSGAGDVAFAGVIADTSAGILSLVKDGSGTLSLSGVNGYTGTTTVNGGVLAVGAISNGALASGGIRLTGGGIIEGSGNFNRTFSGNTTPGAGQISGGSGGFAATGSDLMVTFGNAADAVFLSGAAFSNRLGDNFVFGSATSDSKVIVVNPLNLNGANRNFTVHSGTGGDSAELSGAITANSAVGIIKSGNGKLTLSAANSYTGTTTINAGTLAIDGSVTSSVIVKHTGTLGGNGSITGNLTVESGGTLAAGIGPSMLTAGATTLHSGSIFSWDLDTAAAQTRGTGYGGLITPEVAGNGGSGAVFGLVLQGSQTFADGFWATSRTWNNLFTSDADGLVPVEWASVFSSFRYANGNGTLDAPSPAIGSFTISGSTLTWSAVPEASSAFAGLILSAGLLRRNRHVAGRQWLIGQLT